MFSLEREIEELRPVLGDARADALIARERREVFSLQPELRVAAWAGAMLLATAAGIVLKNNLDRIGPLALASLIGAAAIACYVWAWWRRSRATIADDYVLLLGALLLSADVAFIEQQFGLLGLRNALLLAVTHGVGAYVYRSRMLLSLSITALAAWLGIERRTLDFSTDLCGRALVCAALLIAWRELHRRFATDREFLRVFEHFAANLALCAGLFLFNDEKLITPGALLIIATAAMVIVWGFVQRAESFVLYAFLYGVIGADALVLRQLDDSGSFSLVVFISMIAAIVALIMIHRRFDERRA